MCGATEQQKQISDAQQDFYNKLSAEYDTIFGQNQAITQALTSAFMPILQAGPSQTGFSQSQETAMRTQNTENVATDYAQAQRATSQILAAKGGGNTMLPSSVTANILAGNANAAAATRAQGENQITQANYQQGYQNWNTAASVLGNTAQLINPNAYSGQATTAGGAASTSANNIATANFAPLGAAIGAAVSILGGKVGTGLLNKIPGFGGTATG